MITIFRTRKVAAYYYKHLFVEKLLISYEGGIINLHLKINEMIVFPNAKVNIGLRITSRRSDGYHNIETIFYPVKLCDALEFTPSESGQDVLTVTGFDAGDTGKNLCLKASGLLRERYNFPFLRIHLHKAIPLGAGLGGGSSDAASLLKAVSKHFSPDVSVQELKEIALLVGSDCPFFIENMPSYATGRGEILNPVGALSEQLYIVVLNPGVHSSTSEAYAGCRPAMPLKTLDNLITLPVEKWKEHIFNDFEEYAFRKFPMIRDLKDAMYEAGAVFSLMSGSGSSVYGLFRKKPLLPESLGKYLIYEGEL